MFWAVGQVSQDSRVRKQMHHLFLMGRDQAARVCSLEQHLYISRLVVIGSFSQQFDTGLLGSFQAWCACAQYTLVYHGVHLYTMVYATNCGAEESGPIGFPGSRQFIRHRG